MTFSLRCVGATIAEMWELLFQFFLFSLKSSTFTAFAEVGTKYPSFCIIKRCFLAILQRKIIVWIIKTFLTIHTVMYNKRQSLTRVHFPLLILQQRNAIKLAPGLKAQKTSDLIINWYIIVHYSILRVRLWLLLLYYCSKFLML